MPQPIGHHFSLASHFTLWKMSRNSPFPDHCLTFKKICSEADSLDATKIYSLHFLDDSEVGNVCRIIDSSCETWLQATDSPWRSLEQYTLNLQIVDMFCVEVKKIILSWQNAPIKSYIF